MQLSRQLQNGLHDPKAPLAAAFVPEEAPIQLDGIHIQIVEQSQRGKAGTEVIQRTLETQGMHLVDAGPDAFGIFKENGLRQFKLDETGRYVILQAEFPVLPQKGGALQILPGEVH